MIKSPCSGWYSCTGAPMLLSAAILELANSAALSMLSREVALLEIRATYLWPSVVTAILRFVIPPDNSRSSVRFSSIGIWSNKAPKVFSNSVDDKLISQGYAK